jgi:hypothetical protein
VSGEVFFAHVFAVSGSPQANPNGKKVVAKPLVRGGFDAPTHPER